MRVATLSQYLRAINTGSREIFRLDLEPHRPHIGIRGSCQSENVLPPTSGVIRLRTDPRCQPTRPFRLEVPVDRELQCQRGLQIDVRLGKDRSIGDLEAHMIVAIGLHVEELILEIAQDRGDAEGSSKSSAGKPASANTKDRRAPTQRSIASRIVASPLAPAPTRQLTRSPGS